MTDLSVQGSLLACKQVAERRGLPHKVLSTPAELQAEYPMNAKEGYQGLFEPGAGSIKVRKLNKPVFTQLRMPWVAFVLPIMHIPAPHVGLTTASALSL